MEDVRFCPRCGSARAPLHEFCSTCGLDLNAAWTGTDIADEPEPLSPVVTETAALESHPRIAESGGSSGAKRSRVTPARVGVGVVAIGIGLLLFRYSQDMDAARARYSDMSTILSASLDRLSATGAELSETSASLAITTVSKEEYQTEAATLRAEVARLNERVAIQTVCISDLAADQGELDRLFTAQQENFDRQAEGSQLAKSRVAAEKHLLAALDYYYEGYSRAFDGNYDGANASIDKGNVRIDKWRAQGKIVSAEIKVIDGVTSQIGEDLAALSVRIDTTRNVCG